MTRLRVTLDATPLLGSRTGIGRYVHRLLLAMTALPEPPDLAVTAFTVRHAHCLVDAGVPAVRRPVPARLLQWWWQRHDSPSAELLSRRSDVFHATNFVLPPTRRAAGVVTIHDLAFRSMPETVSQASLRYQDLVPRSVRRAAVVLVPSQAVRDELLGTYRIEPDRVRVTPLGVDPSWFDVEPPDASLRTRLGLPQRYVLFVGTREPRKNLATLVAAHRSAVAAAPGAVPPLVLVGPPGWGAELTTGGDVVTTGFLADTDLRRVVAGAAALAMPSRAEGFGLPVLEAMATGTPVVASDIPVLREVGGPGCDYADPADVDAWASLLTALPEAPDPVAAQARREWARAWTWERTARLTVSAYVQADEAVRGPLRRS